MKVGKAALVAMLLEVGEENAAVLLARSTMPDELDPEHDLEALAAFGLERDQLEQVLGVAIGGLEPQDAGSRRRRDEMGQTISRRWAELVDRWNS